MSIISSFFVSHQNANCGSNRERIGEVAERDEGGLHNDQLSATEGGHRRADPVCVRRARERAATTHNQQLAGRRPLSTAGERVHARYTLNIFNLAT